MKKALLFIFIVSVVSGCKKTTPTPVTPLPEAKINPDVKIVDPEKMVLNTDPVMIENGQFEFNLNGSALPDYKVGDVLYISSDGGYIRKITAIESSGKKVTYTTTQGSMADVFQDSKFGFQVNTDDMIERQRGYSLSFNNVNLFNAGGLNFKLVSGFLNFDPAWSFDFDFGLFKVNKAVVSCNNAVFNGNFNFDIDAAYNLSADQVDTLKKLTKTFTQKILVYGLPVPITVVMDVNLLVKTTLNTTGAFNRQINYVTNNTFNLGLTYENGVWKTNYNVTPDNSFTFGQSTGSGGVTCGIKVYPEVSFKLYNVLGPYGSIGLAGNIAANANPAKDRDLAAKCWIESELGARGTILDQTIADFSKSWATDSLKYYSPESVSKVSGDGQIVKKFDPLTLPKPIKVKVVDSKGAPETGVPVYFTTLSGSVQSAKVLTNNLGEAQTNWTLDNGYGEKFLLANVKKANGSSIKNAPLQFKATRDSMP